VVSGVVTDDAGERLSNVLVEVDYSTGPVVYQTSWVTARTDAAGQYSVTFDASERWYFFMPNGVDVPGIAYAGGDTEAPYETATELLARGTANITRDFKLRRARLLAVGNSTVVTVDGDSPLCFDTDNYIDLEKRCEVVRVVPQAASRLTAELRVLDSGASKPSLEVNGRFSPLGDRVVFDAGPGVTYRIRIGAQTSGLPARYELTVK
jgi:hypothetical protein